MSFSFDLLNHQLYVKRLTSRMPQPRQNDPSLMASGRIYKIYYLIFSHRSVCLFFFILLFLKGNSQGKMQEDGTLGANRAKDDYLLQPFQNGKLIMINIPLPDDRGKGTWEFLS